MTLCLFISTGGLCTPSLLTAAALKRRSHLVHNWRQLGRTCSGLRRAARARARIQGRSGCAPSQDRQPRLPYLSGNSSLEFKSDSRTTAILESSEPGHTTTRFGLRRCWKFEFHGDFAFYICSSGLVTSSCGTGRQLTLNCNSDAVARFSAMAKLAVLGGVGGEVTARAAESPGAGVKCMQEWQFAWLKCGESTCIFDGRELEGRVLCAARDGGKWPVYIYFDLWFAPCFCLSSGRFGGGPIFGFVAIWFILHFLPWPPLIGGGGMACSINGAHSRQGFVGAELEAPGIVDWRGHAAHFRRFIMLAPYHHGDWCSHIRRSADLRVGGA